MKAYISKKYKFNLKTGHYEKLNVLNEDGNTTATNLENNANNDSIETEETKQALTNIETAEVAQLQQLRDAEIANVNNEIKKYNDQINQLQTKYSEAVTKYNADTSGNADPKLVANIQKQLLQAKLNLANATYKLATVTHDYAGKILGLQTKLLESMYTIPGKYAHLNESNIHLAKVYINSLVGETYPITGMVGVKHTFKTSQLFYGKDREGYFVLCIDLEDFDRMYTALSNAGYTRDEILDAIMPQVFDRRELLK